MSIESGGRGFEGFERGAELHEGGGGGSSNGCDELLRILREDPKAADLNERLHRMFASEQGICNWLLRENRDLQWRKPATFVRIGDYEKVELVVEAFDSNVYD